MARTIDEAKALRMLDIPDFRHLSKEKAVQLVSMLDRVDPSVAMAVLEQYPQFAKIVLETFTSWKESVAKALEENGKISHETVAAVGAAINHLGALLAREDISENERAQIADRMIELAKLARDIDKTNKDFILKVLGIAGGVVVGVGATAAAVLGVNIKLPSGSTVKNIAGEVKDFL